MHLVNDLLYEVQMPWTKRQVHKTAIILTCVWKWVCRIPRNCSRCIIEIHSFPRIYWIEAPSQSVTPDLAFARVWSTKRCRQFQSCGMETPSLFKPKHSRLPTPLPPPATSKHPAFLGVGGYWDLTITLAFLPFSALTGLQLNIVSGWLSLSLGFGMHSYLLDSCINGWKVDR